MRSWSERTALDPLNLQGSRGVDPCRKEPINVGSYLISGYERRKCEVRRNDATRTSGRHLELVGGSTTSETGMPAAQRVAVVHEWLSARAGSEILFEELAKPFPQADVFALTRTDGVHFDFDRRRINTSPLDHFDAVRDRRAVSLPIMPIAWRSIRRDPYDVVVTSSHAFAREFFKPGHDGVHCNYVHAPMRYAWNPELDGRGQILGAVGSVARQWLRRRDLSSVEGVDTFAANSREVAARINEFYDREALVIHPPVDVEYFNDEVSSCGEYLLTASRWIPYKRLDLAIDVAAALDMPLVVAGSGPESDALRAKAARVHPCGVTFIDQPERSELRSLMANAAAFIFPPHEDFGIIAVEAQAAGTPVVALEAGGALDTVLDGVTGALAVDQSPEAFIQATRRCLELETSAETCREHADEFSATRFRSKINQWVLDAVNDAAPRVGADAA